MFKPPQLRPRQKRNLKHWGMELVVVVIGVLLALWAQEWVNGQGEAKEHRAAIEALNREIDISTALFARSIMADRCTKERIKFLKSKLEEPGEDWAGVPPMGSIEKSNPGAFPYVLPYPTDLFSTATHERARATGAFDTLKPDQALHYEEIFLTMTDVIRANDEMASISEQLAPLAAPGRINSAKRLELLQLLSRADSNRIAMRGHSRAIVGEARALGLSPKKRGEEFMKIYFRPQRVRPFGECVQEFDFETGEPKGK